MTGVLLAVGEGKMGPEHIRQLLETGNSQPPGQATEQGADCCGRSRTTTRASAVWCWWCVRVSCVANDYERINPCWLQAAFSCWQPAKAC